MQAYLATIRTGNLEGLAVQIPVVSRNAEGEFEVVAERPVENPRAANIFQLLRQLGHTAADQTITPRSSGERDQGLGLAGRAAWVNQMRKGLAAGGWRLTKGTPGPTSMHSVELLRRALLRRKRWSWQALERGDLRLGDEVLAVDSLHVNAAPVLWVETNLVNRSEDGGGLWRLFPYQLDFSGDKGASGDPA